LATGLEIVVEEWLAMLQDHFGIGVREWDWDSDLYMSSHCYNSIQLSLPPILSPF
jgi:hypothetical protein